MESGPDRVSSVRASSGNGSVRRCGVSALAPSQPVVKRGNQVVRVTRVHLGKLGEGRRLVQMWPRLRGVRVTHGEMFSHCDMK